MRLLFSIFTFWIKIICLPTKEEREEFLFKNDTSILTCGVIWSAISLVIGIFLTVLISIKFALVIVIYCIYFIIVINVVTKGSYNHATRRAKQKREEAERIRQEFEEFLRRMYEQQRRRMEAEEQAYRQSHEQQYSSVKSSLDASELLQILELPPYTRDLDTIKRQYRKLAKKYHPDIFKGGANKFKQINYAYHELLKLIV